MSKKYCSHADLAASAYWQALRGFNESLAYLATCRQEFCKRVPVGQTVKGLRHVRVHNLVPNVDKIKQVGLWRAVARMTVDVNLLRKATKDYTLRELRAVGSVKTHHRILDVSKKGGK
jgi:hypothetical protein